MVSIQLVHKYDCDVLIVGGGPAGSALATQLAGAGLNAIVLEAQQFPRDKICGDAVSPVALAELQKIGVTETEEFSAANAINNVALFIGEEKITIELAKPQNMPFHGRVIPRLKLDNWIYKKAREAGAVYWEDSRLMNYRINENGVIAEIKQGGDTKKIKARIIVGADGSNSTVARIFHGSKPSEAYQLLGLRAYYEGVEGPADRCDIFFTGDNFPGLYWFFPTGINTANIGLAMVAKTLPENETHVKTLLTNHIQNNKHLADRIGQGTMTGKIQGWPLTFHNPKNKVVSDRLLLIGDAAGLINPLSGDGIQYALLSARWAADCLVKCAGANDYSQRALNVYKETIDRELAYDLAVSNLLVQITRNRSLQSLWMETLQVLFERARNDQDYARVIAGIFEGTYPSYKALQPGFLLKTLLQGVIHVGSNTANGFVRGPEHWKQIGKDAGQLALDIVRNIREHPASYAQWAGGVARQGLKVSGHILKDLTDRSDK